MLSTPHDLWDTWREEQQVACLWVAGLRCVPGVIVQNFPKLEQRARGRLFWKRLVEIRFACCRLHFVQLPTGHTEQQVSDIVPKPDSRSAPRITSDVSPSVLVIKKCCNSWSVFFFFFFFSTRQSLECSTRRSSASFFLHSSLPVSVLNAQDQRSPLPSATRFSNSGRSSFRTDLASDSSAPPPLYVTSFRFDYGEDSFLDG